MEQSKRLWAILLIEDNLAHIRLIQEAFKESSISHQITPVRDGIEAMAYLQQQEPYADSSHPDLILLDLNLPKKNGLEILATVKSDIKLKQIPVIIVSTSTNQEDITTAYDLHANCYIKKSSNLNQFFTSIKRIEEFWLQTAVLPSDF